MSNADLYVNGHKIKDAIEVITHLDSKFNHWEFPKVFGAIPEIGDYIESNEGPYRLLKVVSRQFRMDSSIKIEVSGTSSHN